MATPGAAAWVWLVTWTRWKLSADRKSTRLNSSHDQISYAVFCLKKKKKKKNVRRDRKKKRLNSREEEIETAHSSVIRLFKKRCTVCGTRRRYSMSHCRMDRHLRF